MTGPLPDLTTGLAFLAGLAALVTTGSWRAALRALLDLLVAAGLLRLSLAGGWSALAVAAAVVALRHLLWAALAAGPPGPAPTSPPRCGGDDHRLALAARGEHGEDRRRTP
ncbi:MULTISPECIES: hypothetical protein [Micromonospora]|uniref:Uncharacterized protein n=1 Tax=Micromonospora sicca TaxID=2202420 RepID=A0A317DIU7_9ACTN|nr:MULTISPECIES: hypothetical protein [unclassified Micromonospora]MBM0227283.1 hypothetical protein [Micromonospora sp. ATA51]PWR14669.1 hypothetical protein DKT69_15075 [Micromonospora sp. 4G51]